MQKRKTLANALVNGKIIPTKQMAEETLISLGFDTNIRGEKLTLEDFKKIYDYLKKIK
jgi:16S rRNA A1518/A1519 N6-dimethyltransferase RsmA/KsgA/DIM1 with predicted DNA glycosylase/AP lyase activity